MIELIRSNINIDFVSKFSKTSIISGVIVLICLFGTLTKMKYGVDFRGGAEVQIKFKEKVSLTEIRKVMGDNGFSGVQAQTIGEESLNEYIVKLPGSEEKLNELTTKAEKILSSNFQAQGVEIRKVDIVGPKAGSQLRTSGFLAMLWALIAIMVYIGLRFDFKYSPGAIVALFHDVIIILGIFAFGGIEFTLQTVAALLAVIGYSVNDTVIVYDRVREHEEKYAGRTLKQHINNAINETLSRTVLTSSTTLFISAAMLFLGGSAIKDFFLAITIGVVVGTYSSIFVAAPVILFFDKIIQGKETKATA